MEHSAKMVEATRQAATIGEEMATLRLKMDELKYKLAREESNLSTSNPGESSSMKDVKEAFKGLDEI